MKWYLKGSGRDLIKEACQHFPGGSEKNLDQLLPTVPVVYSDYEVF